MRVQRGVLADVHVLAMATKAPMEAFSPIRAEAAIAAEGWMPGRGRGGW